MEQLGEKIIKIFHNMEYSQIEDSTTIGKEWLENKMKTDSFKSLLQISESNFSTVLDSSKKALESWHNLPAAGRRQVIFNFNKTVNANSELLSEIDAYIRSVPKSETKNVDIPGIKSYFDYYSSWPERLEENLELKIDHIFVDVPCPPVLLSWLIAPSLAIGHAVLIHSSEKYLPLACFFVEISVQASSSLKDLVNVILSPKITSSENIPFLQHIETDYNISSQNEVLQTIPSHSLESSIYSLMIVYETADLDSSAQIAVDWSTFNSGHVPWSIRRIYVQESVLKEFENKLIQRLNRKGIKQNEDIIGLKEARALGLNIINNFLVIGGVVPSTEGVLCLSSFRTVRESLALIQSTPNLAFTSIWTESGTVAHYVARKIKMGTVWINCHGQFDPSLPITLLKRSSSYGTFGGNPTLPVIIPGSDIHYDFNEDHARNINKIVLKALSASAQWQSMSNINRIHKLLKLLDNFESLSKIKTWLELGEHLNLHHNQAHQFFCPLGIIVIRLNKYDENVYSYLLDALIVGNAIIICCDDKESMKFNAASIKTGLPDGLVANLNYTSFPYVKDHGETDFAIDSFPFCSLKDVKSRLARVSYSKVVWMPDDEIFAN